MCAAAPPPLEWVDFFIPSIVIIMAPLHPARPGRPFRALLRRSLCAFALLVPVACGDGGTGPTPKPDPQNPVPAITSLDPGKLLQGSDSVTVTVTGSGFVNGAVVRLNGEARPTTFVSASRVAAMVPASHMLQTGTVQVSVFNPAPGGGESTPMALPVEHRVPNLLQLDPGSLPQGRDSVTVTVTGTGFATGAVVRLNGSPLPTTFISSSQVAALVPASHMQQVGTVQVTVFNPAPGGGESTAMALPVEHAVPDLRDLEPTGTMHGSEAFVLEVRGVGFAQASIVRWNGADRPTTFVSPGLLRAQIPASDVAQAGTAEITVFTPAPGGGTSPPRVFTVSVRPNPVPVATSLSPTVIFAGVGGTVTVTGSRFMEGTTVSLGGFIPPTPPVIVSPTELRFSLAPESVPNTGFVQVHVENPAPGGGRSDPLVLRVDNPVPVLSALVPGQAVIDQDSLVVRLQGTGFVAGTVIRAGQVPFTPRRISPTELQIVLPREHVGQVISYPMRAVNPAPGGGESNVLTLSLVNPAPTVQAVSPAQVQAGLDSAVVRVTGRGFVTGAVVRWQGGARPTRRISATELAVVLSAADVAAAGTFYLSVHVPEPGGGVSNSLPLSIVNPLPTLAAASPQQGTVGLDSQVVRLTGTGFVRNTVVRFNDAPRTTRPISPTELEVVLRTEDLDALGTYTFRAINAQPGGGASNALAFALVNPVPVVQAVSPAQIQGGLDSLEVRITGREFVTGTVVRFQGAARPTRRVSATELRAVLPAADLDEAGTFALTVFTPAPGGGTSAPVSLVLTAPVPVLSSLPSSGASAGRPGFPLVVHGSRFLRSSVVHWNGQPRTTRFISGTRLEADITTADVTSPGIGGVAVHTPGGGTSATRQITIRTPGSTAVTFTRTLPLPVVDMVYDARRTRIYASIPATPEAGARGNTVVAIDPNTGAITDEVLVGSNPAVLALSEDGSALWVGVNGTGSVRRLSLPGLVPGLTFSLDGNVAEEMKAMPGRPGSVAISLSNTCCSPRHEGVAVYDDGVRRSRTTDGHTGSNSIAFGESASVLYGYNNETTEFGFRTMSVTAEGVTNTHTTDDLISGFNRRIRFAQGRVYSTRGDVLDAARRVRVGTFVADGTDLVVDPALGRIFFAASGQVVVYDLNTFQQLGTVSAGATGRLLRWGGDGLAVSDGQQIHIFRSPIAGP